jgi:hypothetical protein
MFSLDSNQERKYSLRKFGDEKQYQHRHQHLRGAIGTPFSFRNFSLLRSGFRQRITVVAPQDLLPLLRVEHGADQPTAYHRQDATRQQLDDHGVDPEVDLQESVVGFEHVAQVCVVKGVSCFVLYYFPFCYADRGVGRDAQDQRQDVADADS